MDPQEKRGKIQDRTAGEDKAVSIRADDLDKLIEQLREAQRWIKENIKEDPIARALAQAGRRGSSDEDE